ncbi:hypothetical protein B0E38_01798 [Streptomyces sp. 111WW2]|uniref:PP2C family serine/threonine-protein phosphatase n=1 Tax=Streptomyces sp. 111WW2 TaxID=1945515 RepID=UPI000D0C7B12|nr:mucin-2 [Streptomyces sp. 111WW2]PSK57953.1 hypothetical protein B0E38_01798 [Streptomyces sp. 111WW2]
MSNYATAQSIGGREVQCDATAVHTAPSGARAYVLLDGIDTSDEVREWTRTAARRLARAASRRGDAEAGLRHIYNGYAAEETRQGPWGYGPKACALVAVTAPGRPLTVAWCGDVRAYLLTDGTLTRLTRDHNLRRIIPPTDVYPGGSRHRVSSCLGATDSDDEVMSAVGHPAIETATVDAPHGRLVLACDGVYEPHEDTGNNLADFLTGTPKEAAQRLVDAALDAACVLPGTPDNATALVADLTA